MGFVTGWQPPHDGLPGFLMPTPPLLNRPKPKTSCAVKPTVLG